MAEVKTILGTEHNPIKVVTLTKEGNKLLRQGEILQSPQRTYHGLKKPKEGAHDADLYRLYHKVSDEIESQGGRVVGVRLDYELKDELWHALRHTHGTLLHSQGTPLKVAQAQLGHSHMATTLDIYTHASGSAQRDAVNLLEGHLFPNVPKLESCGNVSETESQLVQ